MLSELSSKIRQVTEEDRSLPYISYSKLSNFDKCPLSHKLKYVDGNFSHKSSLAMEIGSILHKGLELKGQMKVNNIPVDYDYLHEVVENGYDEEDGKSDKHILGISELKKKYFEEFYTADSKSGMNYEQKMKIFYEEVLPDRIESPVWIPIATEQRFELVYDNRIIIHGFIDRVDKNVNTGEIKITDYKSSKAVFLDKDIKTPMQHVTYDLACILLYGQPADVHEYDFILINKIQGAAEGVCSKGYLKRGVSKLDKVLNSIEEMSIEGEFPPKPSPLCYWCPFHSDSPNADPKFSGLCQYHSLWTPENKTFATLNPYGEGEYWEKPKEIIQSKRKLVF